MHRLFVALRPPAPIRMRLLAVMGGVPGARWQSDDQLHLTLRFIGEVDRPQADDIAAALATITQPRPTIAVSGVGSFERKGKPHTIWAGIEADAALTILQARIERALAMVGVAPDSRAFKPHITLARLGRTAGSISPFLTEAAGLTTPPFAHDAFLLFESLLGRDGATYNAVARYTLA